MAKLLSTLLFAAALMLGLSAPSLTEACPMKNTQAQANSSPVQLAMDDADDASDAAAHDETKGDEEKSE